jgi:hypothetical protein
MIIHRQRASPCTLSRRTTIDHGKRPLCSFLWTRFRSCSLVPGNTPFCPHLDTVARLRSPHGDGGDGDDDSGNPFYMLAPYLEVSVFSVTPSPFRSKRGAMTPV